VPAALLSRLDRSASAWNLATSGTSRTLTEGKSQRHQERK
jgi:hypothetical protein